MKSFPSRFFTASLSEDYASAEITYLSEPSNYACISGEFCRLSVEISDSIKNIEKIEFFVDLYYSGPAGFPFMDNIYFLRKKDTGEQGY
ncbi:MAG: hypothetical protein ACLFQK_04565 [Fibrobacterota bacterium]